MKTSLIILALALLGFSHAGFAHGPKKVIVLDGQIAINNGPVNPASVMVENGALNPVPVMDVSPEGVPFRGRVRNQHASCYSFFELQQDIPGGMLLRLDGVSANISGDPDKTASFSLTVGNIDGSFLPIAFSLKVDTLNTVSGGSTYSQLTIFQEFEHLPLIRPALDGGFLVVSFDRCLNTDAGMSGPKGFTIDLWGRLFNDPAL